MTTSEGEQVSDKAARAFQYWADSSDSIHLCGRPDLEAMEAAWHAAVAWATARERERAAKVAERCFDQLDPADLVRVVRCRRTIAAAIRKGEK